MRNAKPRYTDDQIRAMLSSGNWLFFRDQLTQTAWQRGCTFTSVTEFSEIVRKLKETVNV